MTTNTTKKYSYAKRQSSGKLPLELSHVFKPTLMGAGVENDAENDILERNYTPIRMDSS